MKTFRIRVFLSESYFNDMTIPADNWFSALALGKSFSPVRNAVYLGE
jgi:hypothetical protein